MRRLLTVAGGAVLGMIFVSAAYGITVTNLTEQTVLFSHDFENSTVGRPPRPWDPEYGAYDGTYTGASTVVVDASNSYIVPFEGERAVQMKRVWFRAPELAMEFEMADLESEGDELRIAFALNVQCGSANVSLIGDRGWYSRWGNLLDLKFYDDGKIRSGSGWFSNRLETTHNPGEWNTVVITQVNGSGEYAISVNHSTFETGRLRRHTDLTGIRLTNGSCCSTVFYDGVLSIPEPSTAVLLAIWALGMLVPPRRLRDWKQKHA